MKPPLILTLSEYCLDKSIIYLYFTILKLSVPISLYFFSNSSKEICEFLYKFNKSYISKLKCSITMLNFLLVFLIIKSAISC